MGTVARVVVVGFGVLGALLSSAPRLLSAAVGEIPATPLMTVYQFAGSAVPYYEVDSFLRNGPSSPAGTLAQGTSVIPCLVIRGGKPVTDRSGTPYVGFEVVVDANVATPASTARFAEVAERRKTMTVGNHHCPPGTANVIDVRKIYALGKAPRFEPPRPQGQSPAAHAAGDLDAIVRAFHASPQCDAANRRLMGRREALRLAWNAFIAERITRWPATKLENARHLDFVMRTALYEGHLGRGCNAYGACERNVIALSIRNRALERCQRGQGCASTGDFEGVASKVSQYNIWDEFLTQTSGLTSCFLRPDLAGQEHYSRLQAMYEQSVGDVERILFGSASDLQAVFPGNSLAELRQLRHYYHPPAMGKCFPGHPRLEYMSGAVARRGAAFALIANTRIEVGARSGSGYVFQQAIVEDEGERDVVRLVDNYPGFVVDERKVSLKAASGCTPYGAPRSCQFQSVARHRKTPSWLTAGSPLRLTCNARSRGEDCRAAVTLESVKVGGQCDTWMQPVASVP